MASSRSASSSTRGKHPQVNFLAHGQQYGLYLMPTQAILVLQDSSTATANVIQMQAVGENACARLRGKIRSPV